MKKVLMTVVGVLALTAQANAQGTWYTNKVLWQSLVTNVGTANYSTADTSPTNSKSDGGVTATGTGNSLRVFGTGGGYLKANTNVPVTFTFAGNAFFGDFYTTDAASITAYIDGSLTNFSSISTTTSAGSFLGYISNSTSSISVKVSPSSGQALYVNQFIFGNGTNPADPGSNVAPEPGTLALALTGGCALLGLCVRRRRMSN
jgi:hypothetical protein